MLEMYTRYANAIGAKDFKVIHKGNFLESPTINPIVLTKLTNSVNICLVNLPQDNFPA